MLSWFLVGMSVAAPPIDPDVVLGRFGAEPTVREVQMMVARFARLEPETVEGWMRDAQRAFLLPKVNLSYEKQRDATDDFFYPQIGGAGLPELEGSRTADDDRYGIKLEWRLDRMVMSSEQIRVINEAQDVVRLRDQLLGEATRLYFERRRLQIDMALDPHSDARLRLEQALLLDELTGRIDAMTGGQFSEALPSTGGR
ncbi:MAG: hypothetical protein AAFV53_24845 [Myxococcota bacterium]